MPITCLVPGCTSRGDQNTINFFRLPKETKFKYSVVINTLKRERREAWLKALHGVEWTKSKFINGRVCSRHFYSDEGDPGVRKECKNSNRASSQTHTARLGRPAALEDINDIDWVPSVLMEIDKRPSRSDRPDFLQPLRSINRCTVCFDHISRRLDLEVCGTDGKFTQFGCILHTILIMSGCPFRTRFCCRKCSQKSVDVFSNMTDLNVLALITNRRELDNTVQDCLKAGCTKCERVFPSVQELAGHLMTHVYECYVHRRVALDRTSDMNNLIRRRMARKATREVDGDNRIKRGKKRSALLKRGSDTDSADTDIELELDNQPGDKVDSEVVLSADGDSCKLLVSEHCYGAIRERPTKREPVDNADAKGQVHHKDNSENIEPLSKEAFRRKIKRRRKRRRLCDYLVTEGSEDDVDQSLKSSFKGLKWPKGLTCQMLERRKRGRPRKVVSPKPPDSIEILQTDTNSPELLQDVSLHPNKNDRMDRNSDELDFPCLYCDFQFSHKPYLDDHIQHDHLEHIFINDTSVHFDNSDINNRKNNEKVSVDLSKSDEDATRDNKGEAKVHSKNTQNAADTSFPCTLCHFNFLNRIMLEYHVRSFHVNDRKVEQSLGDSKSDTSIIKKSDLMTTTKNPSLKVDNADVFITEYLDESNVEEISWFQCDICEFKLTSLELLSYHKKSAHKQKINSSLP